jgi:hypothetical protein
VTLSSGNIAVGLEIPLLESDRLSRLLLLRSWVEDGSFLQFGNALSAKVHDRSVMVVAVVVASAVAGHEEQQGERALLDSLLCRP